IRYAHVALFRRSTRFIAQSHGDAPLEIRWQAIRLIGADDSLLLLLDSEPFTERDCLLPGNVHHRMIRPLLETRIFPQSRFESRAAGKCFKIAYSSRPDAENRVGPCYREEFHPQAVHELAVGIDLRNP